LGDSSVIKPKIGVAKIRIDELLVTLGLAPDKDKAQKLIMAGEVLVDNTPVTKPGTLVRADGAVRVASISKYVGRGGEKLEGALADFNIPVKGRFCIDIGASTGGFTDCLLQRGATLVYAVDVGTNQLDWKLRNDPRVKSFENTNARNLSALNQGNLEPRPDLGVVDVSFISLKLILGELFNVMTHPAEVVALVKPQFELPKEKVLEGGVVESEALQKEACDSVIEYVKAQGGDVSQVVPSKIKGQKSGNQEYFLWIKLN
jgi:23S rRNA (cytidine1920-2'-O)/16S rRNA (cytidine1409-2'-O)-methyltransferase